MNDIKLLLKQYRMMEFLTIPQIITLILWEWFKPYKIDEFYQKLKIGKSVKFAFEDAKNCKKDLKKQMD